MRVMVEKKEIQEDRLSHSSQKKQSIQWDEHRLQLAEMEKRKAAKKGSSLLPSKRFASKSDSPWGCAALQAERHRVHLYSQSCDASIAQIEEGAQFVVADSSHFLQAICEQTSAALDLAANAQSQEVRFFVGETQVVVKEFSTAPLCFNIEFIPSTASAMEILSAHKAELLHYFSQGSFEFEIGRVELSWGEVSSAAGNRKATASLWTEDALER